MIFSRPKFSNVEALLKIGESTAAPAFDPMEGAAFTVLSLSVLNLEANVIFR